MGGKIGKPDFIVVGAPKCGTTSIHRYLSQHPDIFVPEQKEPHFFCSDVVPSRHTERSYLQLFSHAADAARVGEVSIWYLFSERSATAIRDLCGPIQIVAMLRNPIEAAYSWHAQALYNGNEDIASFSEALDAEVDRRCGRRQPSYARLGTRILQYRSIYRYHDQLVRYFDVFGRENVHVVIFDDLRRDSESTFAELLGFLKVAPAYNIDYSVANPNSSVRVKILRDVKNAYIPAASRLARAAIPNDEIRKSVGRKALSFYESLYTRIEPRPPIEEKARHFLKSEFESDVHRLSMLLKRDLTKWVS